MLTAARSELEQEVNRAREDLRKRIGTLAVAGAERILQREIDAGVHGDIVESLAKQI